MKITIEAPAPADIPFDRYAAALDNCIDETHGRLLDVDEIEIVRAERVAVRFDGKRSKSAEARDIADAARWFADPANLADYFA
jgi:hypothetical protein